MCMYIRIHEYLHILHTHKHMDTDAQGHTQLYIHQNTFMPTHTSMYQQPRKIPAFMHSCTHTHAHKHVHSYTHLHSCTSTYTRVNEN